MTLNSKEHPMKNLITFSALALTAPATFAGSTPLPEPSTWLLFGAAAIAILVLKKFKK
jgi:hypothetical protein